ncbi:LuxR C-terminal-related transcriptional regulator [Paraburkholderia sp. J11-2]|uniref:LuxR C-terminal-related transcriptional regulator n=1 Tax=Paraburkholderia sp. J11-2 TaxID=2805431 RepID=UPI002AB76BDE|nr:LuxR C-terminal-related transcriptional regulator [Paraburkholderia sp. J11-2]
MRNSSRTRAEAYLRHLCALGLPSETVIASILRTAREIVGADFGHFIWADEQFQLARVFSECPAAYATLPAYKELQRTGEVSSLIGDFTDWMSLRHSFRNSADVDSALCRSQFHDEVLVPCNGRHFIHVVARQGDRGWGSMILVRERGSRPFSDAEYRAVDVFGAHLGHAIRHPPLPSVSFGDSDLSCVLIVDWNSRILHQSGAAQRLVLETVDCTTEHGRSMSCLAPVLNELVVRLKLATTGRSGQPAVTEIANRWGRFVWRAYPLESDAGCVLSCQHQEPTILQMLSGAHVAGLSGRQQLIAARLACGSSYRTVATDLNVKESTVTDSVRQIYQRLDTHSVDGLALRLRQAHQMIFAAR